MSKSFIGDSYSFQVNYLYRMDRMNLCFIVDYLQMKILKVDWLELKKDPINCFSYFKLDFAIKFEAIIAM